MISCEGYATKHVAVVGLGQSGLAAARALCRSGARVLAWDDGEAARKTAEVEGIPVREPSRINWAAQDALVLSPGIPHTYPKPHVAARMAKDAGVPIIGDVELLITSGAQAPRIAITGTNGKSTTTALVGHILESVDRDVEVGGNLGPAISDMAMMEHDGAYVLELSSYQLELCPSARFKVAVLLNIAPDHLDRHGGMHGYIMAKQQIFRGQGAGDTAIIGLDDEHSRQVYTDIKAANHRTVIGISCQGPVAGGIYVQDGMLINDVKGDAKRIMDVRGLQNLPGSHNAQNIAAAYAIACSMHVPTDDIVKAVKSFPGLAHRQERLGEIDGVTFVNDSKATNAEAAAKALACYDNIHWILGGRAKDGGLDGLDGLYGSLTKAYVIGECAEDFARQLTGKIDVQMCGDLETATKAAFLDASGQAATVLLSPAAASFDQYRNFEVRGDAFREIVSALTRDATRGAA
ncbi:UDP-N-acetylmuramoyl-L-alanine--D-glutamate ligase [Magnetovibrio sp. PR-2]|uniref:UDP-N-acetylmuramoyl-L-alanine--D-glutamate ligase n=1 Tax=Magnetovibrio sp. PR-2 TaxID=3120356 RepID=UPI002FCE12C0